MKHIAIAAAAALMFMGFGASTASAEPYHDRNGGYRHPAPPGVMIDRGGVRIVTPGRQHRRDCWVEKRVSRDRYGHRHYTKVRVCR